ncbi:MAG: GDSL-type esterase/lipase family protein [Candidatus Moranbacteria bacterium]|nr:GDSL-type esterase/lipase family protein [Candidatus Moranbacteria bacterium]
MRIVRICVFGDSIAWGAFDEQKGGWADRLKIHFFNQEDADYAEVYNLSIPGTETTDLLERVEIECDRCNPDIIVISVGTNDSQFAKLEDKNRIPIEKFRKNLEELYKKSLKFTENIVFIGLSGVDEAKTRPVYWDADSSYGNEAIGRYDSVIENFCQEKKLKYISLRAILEDGDWEDGLHPVAKGHEKIFQKIKPEILDIFQKAKIKFS